MISTICLVSLAKHFGDGEAILIGFERRGRVTFGQNIAFAV